MSTTETSRVTVTPHQLYRKVVKKISSTQQTYQEKLKRTISHKYERHISLLESHRKRQMRFQNNANLLDKTIEEKNKQLKIAFLEKDKKINESRARFMSQKKKKLQNSFHQWQNVQFQNQRKHQNRLQESDNIIKKWNEKCEESLSKKKFRLNTISSNLSERSRISSAKSTRHQQEQLQKMLQKVLVNNPQTPQSRQKSSRSKILFKDTQSRVLSASRVTDKSKQFFKKTQQQNLQKYLEKYVKKQTHIKQVRNKKAQLFNQVRKLRQEKSFQIQQMHKHNNYYLSTKRQQMQEKLDSKFQQNRRKNIDANRSLPSIHTKANINLIYGQRNSEHQKITEKKTNKRTSTIQPKFDQIILDQLRNVTLMSKIKNLKK